MTIYRGEYKRIPRKTKRKYPPGIRPAAEQSLGSIWTNIYDYTHTDPYPPLTSGATGNQSIIDKFKAQFNAAVAGLQDASNQLDTAESSLLSIASDAQNDPNYATDWQSNYDKVIALQATRDAVLSDINTVSGWIDSAKSSLGLSAVFIIPWATVAGIAAATAAILAVVFAANSFYNLYITNKWNQANFANAQTGLPPLDGAPTLLSTGFGTGVNSIFSGLTGSVQTLAIAAIILFILLREK